MNNYINILYIFFFMAGIALSFKILLASNFEKLFKQGKILEIRIGYFVVSIIMSFLLTKSVIELIERISENFS